MSKMNSMKTQSKATSVQDLVRSYLEDGKHDDAIVSMLVARTGDNGHKLGAIKQNKLAMSFKKVNEFTTFMNDHAPALWKEVKDFAAPKAMSDSDRKKEVAKAFTAFSKQSNCKDRVSELAKKVLVEAGYVDVPAKPATPKAATKAETESDDDFVEAEEVAEPKAAKEEKPLPKAESKAKVMCSGKTRKGEDCGNPGKHKSANGRMYCHVHARG